MATLKDIPPGFEPDKAPLNAAQCVAVTEVVTVRLCDLNRLHGQLGVARAAIAAVSGHFANDLRALLERADLLAPEE